MFWERSCILGQFLHHLCNAVQWGTFVFPLLPANWSHWQEIILNIKTLSVRVFTWRTKKKWLSKISQGHLNFISDRASSGQGFLYEQMLKMTEKLCISSLVLESQMALIYSLFMHCKTLYRQNYNISLLKSQFLRCFLLFEMCFSPNTYVNSIN